MRRVVTLLNQIAVTLEDNTGLQAQMDSAAKAVKQCQDDNLLLKQVSPMTEMTFILKLLVPFHSNYVLLQFILKLLCFNKALLDEEKTLSAKNQQLKLEVEKLASQVKTAEEGE